MARTSSTYFIYLLSLIIVCGKFNASVGADNVYTILYGSEATIGGLQREVRIIQQRLKEHRRSLNNLRINYATLLKRFDDLEQAQKQNLEDNILPKLQKYIGKKLTDQTTDILHTQSNYQKVLQRKVEAQHQTFTEELKKFETKLLKRTQSELLARERAKQCTTNQDEKKINNTTDANRQNEFKNDIQQLLNDVRELKALTQTKAHNATAVDCATSKPEIAELTPIEYLKKLENNTAELQKLPKNATEILQSIKSTIEQNGEDVSELDSHWPTYTSFLPTMDDKSVEVNVQPTPVPAGKMPSSCDEAIKLKHAKGNEKRGIYALDMTRYNLTYMYGYCLPDPDGGQAWLLIQRRINDKLSFDRKWQDYRNGFGNFAESFFIGFEKIYQMSRERNLELWIQLGRSTGDSSPYQKYKNFAISNEADKYQLKVANIGTEGEEDDLTDAEGCDFQTYDREGSEEKKCARKLHSGWWYDVNRSNDVCDNGNLNRKLADIGWNYFDNIIYVHMAIRPTKRDIIVKGKFT